RRPVIGLALTGLRSLARLARGLRRFARLTWCGLGRWGVLRALRLGRLGAWLPPRRFRCERLGVTRRLFVEIVLRLLRLLGRRRVGAALLLRPLAFVALLPLTI